MIRPEVWKINNWWKSYSIWTYIIDRSDIFAANERGNNFLYYNVDGSFTDVAKDYEVEDRYENGRGTALVKTYRGRLDILTSNWDGNHRAYILDGDNLKTFQNLRTIFQQKLDSYFCRFDNDGYDEIFMNNIGAKQII